MYRINKFIPVALALVMISGCRVETDPEHFSDFTLDIYFTPSTQQHWGWAAATAMMFSHYDVYYSQAEIVDYQSHYFGYTHPSIDDIGWLFWDLGGVDSYVTGTLGFRELKSQLNQGNPVLLQYGGYYSGHFVVLYGYDHRGHVYLHEPGYGTRVLHYDDLYLRYFHGTAHYWESSLILVN